MSASLPARHGLALVSILPLTGCNLMQSPLNPVSPQARDLLWLFWVFTGILFAIWLAVMLALLASLRARRALDADPLGVDLRRENRTAALVAGLAVATGLVVLVLTGLSYAGQRRLSASEAPGLTIRVLGHQWWWELEYEGADPSRSFTTANEIHVPVGVPVLLKLESTDVIHSFWVPSLMGKMDLIPGRSTTLRFTADRAGTYPRPMRRVLRPAARQDGYAGDRPGAGGLRPLAGRAGPPPHRAGERRCQRRRGRFHRRPLLHVPPDSRGRGPPAASARISRIWARAARLAPPRCR